MIRKKLCIALVWTIFSVFMVFSVVGCAALETKAVAIASGIDAMKVETTGSVSSGTVLPNIILGGAVNSICTAPVMDTGKTAQPTYSKSRRNSFFGSLFGVDNTTETIAYTGVPGETADETVKRCQALACLSTKTADVKNSSADTTTQTSSIPATSSATPSAGTNR